MPSLVSNPTCQPTQPAADNDLSHKMSTLLSKVSQLLHVVEQRGGTCTHAESHSEEKVDPSRNALKPPPKTWGAPSRRDSSNKSLLDLPRPSFSTRIEMSTGGQSNKFDKENSLQTNPLS